jgi:hypothetical protein
MTQLETLATLLSKKIERQTLLKEKSKELDDLDLDLFASKFSRFFGSTYLIVKRVLTLVVGVLLIFIASLLYFAPSVVLQNKEFKSVLVENSRDYYSEIAGLTFKQSLSLFAQKDSKIEIEEIVWNQNAAISKAIENEIKDTIRFLCHFSVYPSNYSAIH